MGPVEAREAEEDGRKGAVGGVEPDQGVLDPLRDRNVSPMRNVSRRPARRPKTLPRFTECSAQCIVNDDVTRMHVFTKAT